MEQNFDIIIPSHRPKLANVTKECLKEFECIMYDGAGTPSFSKLINDSILIAEHEIVIIAADNVRPNSGHVKKTIYLLNKGFGFVGLYNFKFFGFTKNLIRTIGFLDERFKGNSPSDVDLGRRLIEHDIAIYISAEVPIEGIKTSWIPDTENFYSKKWQETATSLKRLLPNEKYDYNIGPIVGECNWMPFKNSLLPKTSLPSHLHLKSFNDKPINLSNLKCSDIF